jgi:predicted Zn-dependent peptidase
MYSIDRDMITRYKAANYFGKNLIVVGGGNVNHNELCRLMDKHFGHMPSDPPFAPNTPGKPVFKGKDVFLMESDLTENVNVGIFYEAP